MRRRRTERPDEGDRELELGFGAVVSRDVRRRLLNRDGTFNVRRHGLGIWEQFPLYHVLLQMTWPRFLALAAVAYLGLNLLFALAYAALGPDAVLGAEGTRLTQRLVEDFFFSVQTSSTLGYGTLSPNGWLANVLVTLESLSGLLSFGLMSGLMFARFAQPTAKIQFSDTAVIAPYRDGTAFEFRLINRRSTQISDLQARVILARRQPDGVGRRYDSLELERSRVTFFPLAWTIVHPIDESSPLHGVSFEELVALDAEFLIMLQGFDETFSQTVHARSSYHASEVVYGARFASMFDRDGSEDGAIGVDVRLLHQIERADI